MAIDAERLRLVPPSIGATTDAAHLWRKSLRSIRSNQWLTLPHQYFRDSSRQPHRRDANVRTCNWHVSPSLSAASTPPPAPTPSGRRLRLRKRPLTPSSSCQDSATAATASGVPRARAVDGGERPRSLRAHLRLALRPRREPREAPADSFATAGSTATSACTSLRSSPAGGRSIRWSTRRRCRTSRRVIYDRSPYQERAPEDRRRRTAVPHVGEVRIAGVRRGAGRRTRRSTAPGVESALVVETMPTSFIRRFARPRRAAGALPLRVRRVQAALRRLPVRRDEPRRALHALRRGLAGGSRVHPHRALHAPRPTGRRRLGDPLARRAADETRHDRRASPAPSAAPTTSAGHEERRLGQNARPLAGRAGVRPNAVSIASVVFALVAGVAFYSRPWPSRAGRAAAAARCRGGHPASPAVQPARRHARGRRRAQEQDRRHLQRPSRSRGRRAHPASGAGYSRPRSPVRRDARMGGGRRGGLHRLRPRARRLARRRRSTSSARWPSSIGCSRSRVATLLAAVEALLGMPPRAIRIGLGVIVAGSIVTAIRRTGASSREVEAR